MNSQVICVLNFSELFFQHWWNVRQPWCKPVWQRGAFAVRLPESWNSQSQKRHHWMPSERVRKTPTRIFHSACLYNPTRSILSVQFFKPKWLFLWFMLSISRYPSSCNVTWFFSCHNNVGILVRNLLTWVWTGLQILKVALNWNFYNTPPKQIHT